MTLTPREWEVLTGQVGRSDDLESAIKRALDDSQRIATVPVTQETSDGAKRVVGHAQIYREGENVLATFNINSSSLSKHLGGTLGPFSIGMQLPVPLSADDQNVCTDPDCTYYEPHKHGFACTKDCRCNTPGRVR